MKTLRYVLLAVGALVVLASVIAVAILWGERRTWDAPYPSVQASRDPAVIERGRYLVEGPGHCSACHQSGLSGGMEFHLPLGTVVTPNLTPDMETGIGRLRDEEIARILRHGVHTDGRLVLPFMRFADVSDGDLGAIISYLRSLPPVRHQVPAHQLNALGHVVRGLVLRPVGPSQPPPAQVTPDESPEYGRYLTRVGNCVACHTKVDMRTGALVGPLFAGGNLLPGHTALGGTFAPPNLTPAAATGRITQWNEETFVARLQMGTGAAGSPMPWAHFAHLSASDLRAIYRYLRSLPAVENDTGPAVRDLNLTVSQGE